MILIFFCKNTTSFTTSDLLICAVDNVECYFSDKATKCKTSTPIYVFNCILFLCFTSFISPYSKVQTVRASAFSGNLWF